MSALNNLYESLGKTKSRELSQKYNALYEIYGIARSGSKQVTGIVCEGIAKDFANEFLPTGYKIKNGLIFDPSTQKISPQIDAIVYHGVPLLEYTDVTIIEKEKVKGIIEIKSWIGKNDIFGKKDKSYPTGRNPHTGLITGYLERKEFLKASMPYILFVFELYSDSPKSEIIDRLEKICDMYAVVKRKVPREKAYNYNFNRSISKLINWLRNLS